MDLFVVLTLRGAETMVIVFGKRGVQVVLNDMSFRAQGLDELALEWGRGSNWQGSSR